MQSGTTDIDGIPFYFEVHGPVHPSSSPPLLLLHGGGSTLHTQFGPLLPSLSHHRQVIAFDQLGHGRTPDSLALPWSSALSASHALALLSHLRVPRVDVWGFSAGAFIASHLAIHHPHAVRRVVVQSAPFNRQGSPDEFWAAFPHARLEWMPQSLRDEYLRVAPHPERLQSFFDKGVQRMQEWQGWTAEELGGIEARVLVVAGDRGIVRAEAVVEAMRLIPHAEAALLPGADHMTVFDDGEVLAAMVQRFLDKGEESDGRWTMAAPEQ